MLSYGPSQTRGESGRASIRKIVLSLDLEMQRWIGKEKEEGTSRGESPQVKYDIDLRPEALWQPSLQS